MKSGNNKKLACLFASQLFDSNHIEGSRLTHDQTRYIFETNTIGFEKGAVNVDDVIVTANHFRCIDMVIDQAGSALRICEMLSKGKAFIDISCFLAAGDMRFFCSKGTEFGEQNEKHVQAHLRILIHIMGRCRSGKGRVGIGCLPVSNCVENTYKLNMRRGYIEQIQWIR